MIFSKYLHVWHLERYPHRLSMEGELLFYYALVAKKRADIPREPELLVGGGVSG